MRLFTIFYDKFIRQRLSVLRINPSSRENLRYFGGSQMITLAKLNGAQESLWAEVTEGIPLYSVT